VLGTKSKKADGLSRQPDWKVGMEKDNKNKIFIKNYWLYSLHKVVIERLEIKIVEKIRKARGKNKEIIRVVEEMKKAVSRSLTVDFILFYFLFSLDFTFLFILLYFSLSF